MENGGVSTNLRTILILGIVVIVITIILAAAAVIAVIGSDQNPAPTLGAMAVTATNTSVLPPTATFTPSPTEIPPPSNPSLAQVPTCQNVSGEALSVREGPGVAYDPPPGALSPGQVVTVVGKNAQHATWWKITVGELKGWVSAQSCVGDFDPNQVPIIYAPPAPPCWVEVPDLTQRKIDEAEEGARQARLLPARDARCMSEGDHDLGDVVTGQSLAPGSRVGCGTQILLTFMREGDICPPGTACAVSDCAKFGGEVYALQSGDLIAQLCRDRGYHGPTLDFCIDWTALHSCIPDPENLQPGSEICLPPSEDVPTPTPSLIPTEAPPPEPIATTVVLTGRIYFPVFDPEEETYNIFSANVDGGDRQLVIAEASQPAVDSSGGRIAFISWKADKRGLMERRIEGGQLWIFDPFFEGARPTFSPDGGTLLFHSREGGEKAAIYRTIGREHEVLRREAHPIQGEVPAWLPNGAQFVYKGCLGNDCGLILSNLDGSFPRQLTPNLSDTNPTVSPDGGTIAFMSQTGGTWDVYTMGVDGSNRRQLTTDPANDGLPTWSPDGGTIAFVSDRGGEWAIWAMDADGGDQRRLFELGGSIDGQVWVDVQNSRGWLEESIAWAP